MCGLDRSSILRNRANVKSPDREYRSGFWQRAREMSSMRLSSEERETKIAETIVERVDESRWVDEMLSAASAAH